MLIGYKLITYDAHISQTDELNQKNIQPIKNNKTKSVNRVKFKQVKN